MKCIGYYHHLYHTDILHKDNIDSHIYTKESWKRIEIKLWNANLYNQNKNLLSCTKLADYY